MFHIIRQLGLHHRQCIHRCYSRVSLQHNLWQTHSIRSAMNQVTPNANMSDDESDFYGDEEVVEDLEKKVANFDVKGWWKAQETPGTPVRRQVFDASQSNTHLHNPYAGYKYAWQLTETVDAFLSRLPPATTDESLCNPWIWICNPYIKRQSRQDAANQQVRGGEDEMPEGEGADLPGLMSGGELQLHMATAHIDEYRKPGISAAVIAREAKKAGAVAVKEILDLAKTHGVTCGKWMLFCDVPEVNEVWAVIATATANNELGIGAKVATRRGGDHRAARLICVYTEDFSDKTDVTRVARRLKQLGLVTKTLYYKPDAFTYLGIASGNPWDIRASIYDTRSLLGK